MSRRLQILSAEAPAALRAAAALLESGGLLIVPTDTVYGLAAHPKRPEAVARLYGAKGRAHDKPIALLASDRLAAERFGIRFPPPAIALADRFWPGPLTLVLEADDPCGPVPGLQEGVRVPDLDVTRELLRLVGGVLRVTSANLSGHPPARTAPEALQALGERADGLLDAGPSPGGTASTVVRPGAGGMDILREGALAVHELRAVLGETDA